MSARSAKNDPVGTHSAARLTFAAAVPVGSDEPDTKIVDGVEYIVGKPIHIFPAGDWTAVDGRHVEFNAQDADALVSDLKTRHADVALTFDHETDKARGSEAAGWMPVSEFVFKQDGLWNMAPLWVISVYTDLISTGKFRYLSGDALGIGSANNGDAFHPRRLLAASLVPKPGFVRGLHGIQLHQKDGCKNEKCAHFAAADPAADEDHTADECDDEECDMKGHKKAREEKMGANKSGTLPGSTVEPGELAKAGAAGLAVKGFSAEEGEKFAANLGRLVADQVVPAATKAAETAATAAASKQVNETFAARKTAEEIDGILLAAEKEGRLVADKRESMRQIFSSMGMEKGKEILSMMPVVAPTHPLADKNAFITGGVDGETLNLFALGKTEAGRGQRDEFLSESSRWAAEKGIDWLTAMSAVRRGENKAYEAERQAAMTGGEQFAGRFRPSLRSIPVDPELIAHVQKAMRDGKIPDAPMPGVQRFAALTSFQPAARTTLPMGLGFYQANFIGPEMLQEFVGGADERAAWPEYGLEKFDAAINPVAVSATPPETDLSVAWHAVTLKVYARTINIDRRSRAASVTLPEGLDTTAAENVRVQVETGKERAIAAFMNDNSNYKDSSYYTTLSGTTQWSHASGLPLTNIPNAMAHVRKGCRVWPDLFALSAEVFISLRRNPQIIAAVQYTGTLARPGQMVPIETLIALFGMSVSVGEAGAGLLPDGSDMGDIWRQDAYAVVTGRGKVVAPRFGALVTAGGYPKVRMWPREDRGANGSDAITFSDAWNAFSVNKAAAYHWVNASASL